jgi:hypothetical protein
MSGSVAGLLIHATAGILGALGRRVKRRGFAAQAAFSTAWRLSWIAAAVPMCTEYGGVQPDPGMPVLVVVVGEEHAARSRP